MCFRNVCVRILLLQDPGSIFEADLTSLDRSSGQPSIMLGDRSDMIVTEEDFSIYSPLEVFAQYGQWLTFWTLTPKGLSLTSGHSCPKLC